MKPQKIDPSRLDPRLIHKRTCELVREQKARNRDSGRTWGELSCLFAKMHAVFEAKDPTQKLFGHQTYTSWQDCHTQELGISRRHGYYLLGVGQHLIPSLGEKFVDEVPFEASKALAEYAKAKGSVDPELVKLARTHPYREVEAEVDRRLYHGNDNHRGGPIERLLLRSGRDRIQAIRSSLESLKPMIGIEDEAEIIEYSLRDEINDRTAEESQVLAAISSMQLDPKVIALLRARKFILRVLVTDPEVAKRKTELLRCIESATGMAEKVIIGLSESFDPDSFEAEAATHASSKERPMLQENEE